MKKKENQFSIWSRLRSFKNAFTGLGDMLSNQRNAWVHAIMTILALSLSWWLDIDRNGLALIFIAIVLVWVAEAFNTVLEIMADVVASGSYSNLIRRAKDIAAAGVLVTALGAVGIGLIVFGPRLYERIAPLFQK